MKRIAFLTATLLWAFASALAAGGEALAADAATASGGAQSTYEFRGNSSTYLRFSEDLTGNRVSTIYEYLDLHLEGDRASFHTGGWFKGDLRGKSSTDGTEQELRYAYFALRKGSSLLNIGRFYVFEGVASEQIDGIYARTAIKGGFGISAYGGSPAETDFDKRSGDSVYGGRVSHGVDGIYRLGASYLKEENDSADFREEAGVDLFLRPAKPLEILGKSSYNADKSAWMEHSYYATLSPHKRLRLSAESQWVDYKYFFQSATTSAFSATLINPDEKLSALGGSAEVMITDRTSVSADYKGYSYDIRGNAEYYGGKAAYYAPGNVSLGVALHKMDGGSDDLRYGEYRAYGSKKWGRPDIAVDLLHVAYEKAINGVKDAYTAAVAGGFDITKKARVSADVEYSKNPNFDREVKGQVVFKYKFGPELKGSEAKKPEANKKGEKR